MIVDLTDTNAGKIASAMVQLRHQAGAPTVGMVMTLVIVADEHEHYDAMKAALEAAHEHPSRILVVVPRPGRGKPRVDAEVRYGGDAGPGETVVMRLHGPLADHAASVVLPLLLPDAPVMVWWPGKGPDTPSADKIGRLAQRRVTDAAARRSPDQALDIRADGYQGGDTDLSWTRITGWRTLLAALFDQPYARITGGEILAERSSPSGELLARWLEMRLKVPVERKSSRGPGISGVRLHTVDGAMSVLRPDGRTAVLEQPGQPDRHIALFRRSTSEAIAEEMRRLDEDEVYGEVLRHTHRPPPVPKPRLRSVRATRAKVTNKSASKSAEKAAKTTTTPSKAASRRRAPKA
ncbi:MAG: glucose-6-phosphate dehydrogenase assembly protein OpcA [Candidatus Nanopelagicales bacterium]